ncbi:MAG: DUF6468 domain-containing protein [Rickettsiales bacterium]|jgi:hypothetical protein|nr:DUF6468 domain-containing protein [Rickettsiales bacterium]
MTGIIANLLLNILIVGLLAATISYCWVLNRRIKMLQDSKSELAQLLGHFDESTQRASESIVALQTASKRIGENIQHRIDKANYLIDDLGFLIERGNKLTNQIEASLAVNRARSKVQHDQEETVDEPILVKPAPTLESRKPAEKAGKEKAVASLEAVLERVVGRSKQQEAEEEETRPKPSIRGRSKAEQELLDIVRSGLKG